tara:strand:+ start:1161 stop:1385 length:225 start_codon:yes stop_codon:yes gene_type:complete
MTPFYTKLQDGHDKGGGYEWWQHYCNKQDDVMSFQKGVECDWCGMTEEVIEHNKKQQDFMKKYMEWRNDESETN